MNLPPMNMFEFVPGTTSHSSAEDLSIGILAGLTLEDSADEHCYEPERNTAFAPEYICSITGCFSDKRGRKYRRALGRLPKKTAQKPPIFCIAENNPKREPLG